MSLPTVMITFEKAIQKVMTRPRRSVHHTNFLWASFACQEFVRSTTQRFVAPSGEGFPFAEITPTRSRSAKRLRVSSES